MAGQRGGKGGGTHTVCMRNWHRKHLVHSQLCCRRLSSLPFLHPPQLSGLGAALLRGTFRVETHHSLSRAGTELKLDGM